jgi:hydrogenase maturation protease
MTTLVLGYGNLDRQDDGVAWHVLATLMKTYGHSVPDSIDIDTLDQKNDIYFYYQLQLLPELADDLCKYDRAVFIDAHTGSIPNDIEVVTASPSFQNSPLTHHLTVNSLLYIAQSINRKVPETILVSIRGHEFKFSQQLSPETNSLVPAAVDLIYKWIKKGNQLK